MVVANPVFTPSPSSVFSRVWLSGIVIYNVVSGVLAILNPRVLDALFPGSAAIFGRESTMLSRVLGSYALSIGTIHTYDILHFWIFSRLKFSFS